MLKTLTIAENPLDKSTWKEYQTENILDFLILHFKEWPEGARIYHKEVSEITDITPGNFKEVEDILKMEGPFYVIVYPGEVTTIIAIVMAVIAIAVVVLAPKPKIPNIAVRNSDNPSSNNQLSNRVNKERINARIPDIYGQVRSVPDLISLPYRYFKNNVEIEHSYMCIGKGEFDLAEIREDTTLISDINGCSVEVYGPNTSPNSGDDPILSIGSAIATEIQLVYRYSSVNGQVLAPAGVDQLNCLDIQFTHDSKILNYDLSIDFTSKFSNGDVLTVFNAIQYEESPPDSGEYVEIYNFDGTYHITSVTANEIVVSDAAGNADWAALIALPGDSEEIQGNLKSDNAGYIGPFVVNRSDTEQIWCNFVALNGIYKDNGTTRTGFPVQISTILTPVDEDDVEIGPPEEFLSVLQWNGSDDLSVGLTLKAVPTFVGRCKVKCRRVTAKTIVPGSQVVEEIKWRDIYGISPIEDPDFGNVTTIQSLTVANSSSLEVKERKLNVLATRKIPARLVDVDGVTSFTEENFATKQADDIISHVCLERYIGNRQMSEIDFDSIYSSVADIIEYFGTEKASEFSYTFDSANMSFEEILSSIANSIFSIAYRRGSQLKLSFEKENEISTILFNHRNKIPGTESRTVIFGNENDNDGIEFQYVDSSDDSIVSIYIPEDKSAINPQTTESIGIRSHLQAYFHANRLYNKLIYRSQSVECEVTQESNICVINDRILISDGTRLGSFEGEVTEQFILELTLSKNLDLLDDIDYTIFLQYYDGTVESIPIVKTDIANKVILDHSPSLPLVLEKDYFARTTFLITANNDTRKTAFLLTEKSPKSQMTSEIKAVNYDARYYQNDLDFINGVVLDS